MSSYKSYNDLRGYRTRSNAGMGVLFRRNSSTSNSSSISYRPNYSTTASISRESLPLSTKEKIAITNSIHDKNNKLAYKYSGDKVTDKHRLNSARTSTQDVHVKSPAAEKPSLLEKYTYSSGRITPCSLVEKYSNRIYGREKSREPETTVRYVVNTFPGSRLRANYGSGESELRNSEKKTRPEDSPSSYRPPRTNTTTSFRSSREPSPEVGRTGEASRIKVYARVPNYTLSAGSNRPLNSNDVPTVEADAMNNTKEIIELKTIRETTLTNDDPDEDEEDDDDDDDDDDEDDDVVVVDDDDDADIDLKDCDKESLNENNTNAVTITVVTRGTSPGPPASSSFVRIRRADAARYIEWEITRAKQKIETEDVGSQCDWMGYTPRYSRCVGGTKVSSWPSHFEKSHSSGRVTNFVQARQSPSPTRPTVSSDAPVVPISCQNTNSQLKTSGSRDNIRLHYSCGITDDETALNVVSKQAEPLQKLPVHQVQLLDKMQEGISQKRENSTSSIASSSSSPSLSSSSLSSSHRELLSRSDGATISNRGKLIFRNSSVKNSSKQRQQTRTDGSTDGSSVSLPTGKSKSASLSSSTSRSVKIRTSPSSSSLPYNTGEDYSTGSTASTTLSMNSRERNTSGARGRPPVPKSNENNSTMRPTGKVIKYINKDFRKSALNMPDAADPTSKSKYHREREKSSSKSVPLSSQDSSENTNSYPKLSHISQPRSNAKSESDRKSENSSIYGPGTPQNSRISSKSPSLRNQCSTPSSSETSRESSVSESSDGDDPRSSGYKEQRNINGASSSLNLKRSQRISVDSSRTSIRGSSAEELSLAKDQLPRSISHSESRSGRSKNKSDNTKSLIKSALAPVKKISRSSNEQQSKSIASIRSRPISKSITKNLSNNLSKSEANINNGHNGLAVVKRDCSDEKGWWIDSNLDNAPDGLDKLNQSQDDMSEATTVSMNLPDDGNYNAVWQKDSNEHSCNARDNDTMVLKESVEPSVWQKNSSHTNITPSDYKNRLRHQQSGERAWWMSDDPAEVPEGIEVYPSVVASSPISINNNDIDNSECLVHNETLSRSVNKIRHIDSGEKAWWMDSNSDIPEGIQKISSEIIEPHSNSDSLFGVFGKIDVRSLSSGASNRLQAVTSTSRFPDGCASPTVDLSLGDRASPEGVEHPSEFWEGRDSPYDNEQRLICYPQPHKRPSNFSHFIGKNTNIDDILDGSMSSNYSSLRSQLHKQDTVAEFEWDERSRCEEIDVAEVIIHDSTPKIPVIQRQGRNIEGQQPDDYIPLDDTALQLYKDGDYGAYLDLEASISEQQEEFESFQTNRKNSIILRTQLSVRVHTIIEKLLNSEGRELRRALFSLKQIFQEDKDLVHEFVQNDGLACLIKVGNEADQNYQNYILRALGQVMLYVDGMNGVMEHGQTVQWLYALIASRFRLVVKTALKLLLVFVEYIETNSLLLVRAVRSVDTSRGMIPWTNVMKLLKDYDAADTELLIYATTLVNKCLNGIPDQDNYYDQVDCLEEQGIEGIIQRYMSKQGTDLDLLRQFQIYEAVLHHEDGNDRGSPIRQLDDNIRKTLRSRKCLVDSNERRKSRRHSTGTSPLSKSLNVRLSSHLNHSLGLTSTNGSFNSSLPDDDDESSSSHSSQGLADVQLNGSYKENKDDVGVTPALRRRRERAERQRSFIREQQEATATMRASVGNLDEKEVRYTNGAKYERNNDVPSNKISRVNSRKDFTPLMNAANKNDSEEKKPWYGKSHDEGVECDEGNHSDENEDRRVLVQMKRDGTVKDLTQKLAAQNLISSNTGEEKISRIGDMSGLISKAKEGLAKSKSKADILKLPSGDNVPKLVEVKKSENELHWEELVNQMKRPLALCDLDFTDLNSDDEVDVLGPVNITNGVPPPPPPMAQSSMNGNIRAPPPPPLTEKFPPPFPNGPSPIGANRKSNRSPPASESTSTIKCPPQTSPKKNKKTVKLFWKEVREDPVVLLRLDKNITIWDELTPVSVDTQKLEHLFESRAKDLITKKQQEMNKNKEIIVLDHKRSNTINIGMTKLPPPRSIKTAILKMDATIMSREGIEKLLTMLPTEDERSRIQDAQAANPDLPLGSAEQFLLTLASISELPARLKLWAFKLDFENSEKEIADPLMDLKQGMETLKMNKTFRGILSTLLSIGIFLNGNEVKGFQLEYLTKVPEVKDTVHKHSLLHHLCHMVMEKFPDSTDLYSEIGAVTRASRIDFDELAGNIGKLESECKASWDHLKLIAKHDGSTMMKVKMSDFLADCAERIIVLGIVHRRIINRFHKFILWLGIPLHRVQDTKPNEFCRIVSEFALEYRTTRERVLQQLEKKANHRERNKTRGKMITEVGKFRSKEDRADAELRQLLGSDISDVESIHGTLPWRRQRKEGRRSLGPILRDETTNGNVTDGDDELLESLVKTATKSPATRATPRERKRTRHADRKSLRRTLKNGLSEEEKKHIAAYIKGY